VVEKVGGHGRGRVDESDIDHEGAAHAGDTVAAGV
jgi:hypothetical protein